MNIIKELHEAVDVAEDNYSHTKTGLDEGILMGLRQAVDLMESAKERLVEEAVSSEDVQEEWKTSGMNHKDEDREPKRKELMTLLKRGIYANDSGVATDFYSGALSVFGHN